MLSFHAAEGAADGKGDGKVRSDKAQEETGRESRKLFKKADALLISVILLFLLLFPLLKSEGGSAVAHVYLRDKEIACIELDKVKSPVTIRPNTKPRVEIRAEKGFIYYSYAECPDKLCVKAGKLSKPGSTAACLPSKTLIVIEGKRPRNAPDVITY